MTNPLRTLLRRDKRANEREHVVFATGPVAGPVNARRDLVLTADEKSLPDWVAYNSDEYRRPPVLVRDVVPLPDPALPVDPEVRL